MGRKKKDEERTCGTCRFGPEGQSDDCDECEDFDAWAPKEPDHQAHGERLIRGLDAVEKRHNELPNDCKISVNGGPEVPFPSPEATEQVTEMVKGHVEKQTQLDLDMKPAEYPVGVEEESYTVLTFECGSWSLKVREDRLQRAAEDDNILGLVQRRLKAGSELYPLSEGEFDRWVQRFTRSLTNYVRTGCA